MKQIEAIIFDLDGTLYSFDQAAGEKFTASKFAEQIKANCVKFFADEFSLEMSAAKAMLEDINQRYAEGTSLAVEREFGIDRYSFFKRTWNIAAEDFVESNDRLATVLTSLTVKSGVLTAAPRIWAERVLKYLNVEQVFGETIFTGEPDIRKPNPLAFQQLVDFWQLEPTQVLAIGDQEESDILPAKSLGMQTLRITQSASTSADFQAPDVITALNLLHTKGVI